MASRLLLFATPIAVLMIVLRVPANSKVVSRDEVQLAPVRDDRVSERGDYRELQLADAANSPRDDRDQFLVHATDAQSLIAIQPVAFESPTSAAAQGSKPGHSPRHSTAITHGEHVVSDGGSAADRLRHLSRCYWTRPNDRASIESELERARRVIFFEKAPHILAPHIVQHGETLGEIAKRYRLSWAYLAELNELDSQQLQVGQQLKIVPGPFDVIIERSRHRLTVHAHGYVVATFEVGLGMPDENGETRTPLGTYTVGDRITNPTWYGPDHIVQADDPLNPLGEHWVGLRDADEQPTGLGIHGTIAPETIGKNASNGCVRLRNNDMDDLFRLLVVGANVEIRE